MDRLFELLKKLKNSNYYYYADFDEEEMADSDEESSTQKDKEKDKKTAKKKNDKTDSKAVKSKEPGKKVTPITPTVTKLTPKAKPTPNAPLEPEQSTEEELTNRIEALKTQVELLKKSKSKEGEILKAQFVELRREKEAMELQRQIEQKQMQYYQNMESANELLQKQLAVESDKVAQLHGKLKGTDDESKRIASLEAELERTKSQLLKHIKNDTTDPKEAAKQVDYSLKVARLEEELETANKQMAHYVEYNEQLEVQLSSQTEQVERQKIAIKAQAEELKAQGEAVRLQEVSLKEQVAALALKEQELNEQAETLKHQAKVKAQEVADVQETVNVVAEAVEPVEEMVDVQADHEGVTETTEVENSDVVSDAVDAQVIAEVLSPEQITQETEPEQTEAKSAEVVKAEPQGQPETPAKAEFSDNLKALYRDLAETKKEAHLLFDEVMTVVNKKAE